MAHVFLGNMNGFPVSGLQPSTAMLVTGIWEEYQDVEGFSLLFVSACQKSRIR